MVNLTRIIRVRDILALLITLMICWCIYLVLNLGPMYGTNPLLLACGLVIITILSYLWVRQEHQKDKRQKIKSSVLTICHFILSVLISIYIFLFPVMSVGMYAYLKVSEPKELHLVSQGYEYHLVYHPDWCGDCGEWMSFYRCETGSFYCPRIEYITSSYAGERLGWGNRLVVDERNKKVHLYDEAKLVHTFTYP